MARNKHAKLSTRAKRIPKLTKIPTKYLQEIVDNGERMQTDQARYDYGAAFTIEDVQAVLHQRQDIKRAKQLARHERLESLSHCASCGILKTPQNTGMQGTSMRPTCRACTALKRKQERQARKGNTTASDTTMESELPF
jgi:hypothetical protein